MNKRNAIRSITLSAVIAAVYAVLTVVLYAPSYGPVQLRFAEALTVLPFFLPEAVPGLFVGCIIANLFSPYGIIDVIFGSLASLLAAFWTSKLKNPWLAPLPPVVCNAVLVGFSIAWSETGFGLGFPIAWAWNGFTVGLGELGACYVLGMLLLYLLPKIPAVRRFLSPEQLDRLPGKRPTE